MISGERGMIEIASPMHRPASFVVTDAQGRSREESFEVQGAGYCCEMWEATRCIQAGLQESPVMPWADTVRQMELLDGMRAQIGLRYPDHDGPAA